MGEGTAAAAVDPPLNAGRVAAAAERSTGPEADIVVPPVQQDMEEVVVVNAEHVAEYRRALVPSLRQHGATLAAAGFEPDLAASLTLSAYTTTRTLPYSPVLARTLVYFLAWTQVCRLHEILFFSKAM